MKYSLLLSLGASSALFLSACEKQAYDNTAAFDKLTLPAATTSGAGFLACNINGHVWTPFGKYEQQGVLGSILTDNSLIVYSSPRVAGRTLAAASGQMSRVRQGKPTHESMLHLDLLAVDTLGTKRYLNPTLQEGLIYQEFTNAGHTYRNLAKNPIHVVVSRFDADQKIISGTFEGYLFSDYPNDSIHVTEGRFDFKLPF
ncbi:hypothetical protein [Hymenobacter guriensis]|uniref:Uncharacterized protein n=1 Tax=Hymenobacter guriensis TaxID=2793065 RepID=A0ABS0L671_9BACT|nr:hypothetical protein [Hymenobacter guriensis]MBG8555631.1 hypothetical protein [Hymenobacter guriensis]